MFEDQQRKSTGVRGAQRAPDFSGLSVQPRALPPQIFTPQLQRQAQVGQHLAAHTFRPMALQRQQVGPVLEASGLQREVDKGLRLQRQDLQAQVSQSRMSNGAVEGALQRQTARYAPVPALQQAPAGPAEWVQAARVEVRRVADPAAPDRTRWLSGAERERHLGSLRSVGQGLAQGFKADRGPAVQRYAEYGEQLATLQRQPLTGSIPRMVLAQLSPSERPMLQRAVDEALQRYAEQDAQDQAALNQHALQRQLAELDHQAERPLLERIQARRGAGAPLPAAVQRQLEIGLNHDLSGVRVHNDGEADLLSKKVNAVAFTTGQDIYFQSGKFDPNSKTGIELLAHEATHTVQQSRGQVGKGIDPDAGLEQEARTMGHKIAHVLPSSKSLMPPSSHAPGVYSKGAALQRAQDGAAGHFALKPLYDLQPQSVQRAPIGDLTLQRFDLNPLHAIEKGASALASKAKDAAMSAVKAIPGYKELSMAFGKDLVTGSGLGSSPEAILNALANWVPGPLKDIIRALKETNVIGKAWDWFKGQLGKLDLGGVLGEVKDAVFKLPPDLGQAKSAVTRRVSGLMNLIKGSAQKIAEIGLTALTAGLGPLGKTIMASLKGAGDVIVKVLKDPVAFAKHLVEAVKGGFQKFAGNAPKHLQNGIGQWLTGSSGITFPSKFDLEGVFMVALSVMGLTYQNLRGKLVRALGPGGSDKVSKAETTIDTLKSVKGGLQHASEVKGQQSSVGTAIQDGIKSEVTKSLVVAGIQKVVTMLIPGGGFINAIIGAFQTVQTVIQQGAQIARVVTSALGSIGAIAAGNIGSAVGLIDRTLGGAIPVALAWLGKVVGIGNIGNKVKSVILKVRSRLDSVVDKLVGKVKGLIDKLFGKGKELVKNTADKAKNIINGIFGKQGFSTKNKSHSIWVDIKNNTPKIMIASTPREARVQLNYAHSEAVQKNPSKKKEAGEYLKTGLGYVNDAIAELKQVSGRSATGKDNREIYFRKISQASAAKIVPVAKLLLDLAEEGEGSLGNVLPPHPITFECKKTLNFDEYVRQVKISEAVLQSLTVEEFFKRRSQFKYVVPREKFERNLDPKNINGRDDYYETTAMSLARSAAETELRDFLNDPKESSPVLRSKADRIAHLLDILQTGIRAQLPTIKNVAKKIKLTSALGEAKENSGYMRSGVEDAEEAKLIAKRILGSLALLHSLDQVAGGLANQLAGTGLDAYGDARIDFSIGSSWNRKGRLAGLEAVIRENIGIKFYPTVKLSPVTLIVHET